MCEDDKGAISTGTIDEDKLKIIENKIKDKIEENKKIIDNNKKITEGGDNNEKGIENKRIAGQIWEIMTHDVQ